MVFVEPDAFDVIPSGRLMTPVAFIDFDVFHARHLHRDHLEMLHIVAWGRLMTLRAIERALGRVPVAGNGPRIGDMTLAAVIPE